MPFANCKSVFAWLAAASTVALITTVQTSAASSEQTLYTFCTERGCSDGSYPGSGVVVDNAGNLYGTTNAGGAGFGVVFKLTPSLNGAWAESVLYTFSGLPDGDGPNGLTFDSAGNLYGTTIYGGGVGNCANGGCGTVFQLTLVGGVWTKNTLYRFSGGNDGGVPLATVVLDSQGNVYGTTSQGGAHGLGTVFALINSKNGWTEKVIHNFAGGSDGSTPLAGLILDEAGNLFGTTNLGGGPSNGGTVFELERTKQGLKAIMLHRFTGNQTDGSGPYAGSLAFDRKGNLYGTTAGGGTSSLGTVFRLSRTKSGVKETVLYSFLGGGDGSAPYTGVTIDAAGDLYGTTSLGGNGGDGSIFVLKNAGGGWSKTELYSFSGSDGSEPFGNLVFDSTGTLLFGTAVLGGSNGTGTGNVFEVTP